MNSTMRSQTFWLSLLGLTGLGLALRLFWIDRPSFWIDELYTVMHTTRFGEGNLTKQFGYIPTLISLTLGGGLPERALSENPEQWAASGVTHTLVRLPSAIIGTLTILLLGWLSRGIVGARTALWFTAFLAVAVWHLHMSQTGRFYAQQLLFYNLGFLLYYRATSIGSLPRLALSMAMLFLGFMSQPPALILGGIIFVDWVLGIRKRDPKRLTVPAVFAGGLAAAACAGVLVLDISRRTDEWTQFAGQLSQSWQVIILGVVWLIGPAVVVLATLGTVRLLQRDQRLALYLVLGAVMPVIAMALLSATGQFVHVRYAFIALPSWLLLAASGAARAERDPEIHDPVGHLRAAMPGLLVLVASMLQCFAYYTGASGFRPAWREAYAYIEEHRRDGDLVAGDEHSYWQARYYLGDASAVRTVGTELWDLLDSTDQRVWIVDKGGAGAVMRWRDLPERAQLQWYFDAHVLQPFSTVKVFRYDPVAAPDAAD